MYEYLGIKEKINIEKPEYSYTAHTLLDAYNTIARSRRYEQGVPLAISASDINAYMQLNDIPVELDIFMDAIFMLDNNYIDEAQEKIKSQRKPSK